MNGSTQHDPQDPATPTDRQAATDRQPKRRRALKRLAWIVPVTVVLLIAVAIVVMVISGRPGEARVERWVGKQIAAVVNGYLNPQLEFETFDYTYPLTVEITDARLVADAPEMPEGRINVLEADRLLITLAQIPRPGRQIRIEQIQLDRPVIRAVTESPESGQFHGFANLVKTTDIDKPKPDDAEPVKLSDVLQLRLIRINDGRIVYDDRTDGADPMVLDGLTSEMTLTDPEAGWHTIAFTFGRRPLLNGRLDGRLSLDLFKLDVAELKITGELAREHDRTLPPQLQALLKQYNVTGRVEATLAGMINFNYPDYSELQLEAALTDGFMQSGQYRLPIQRFALNAKMKDRKLDVTPIDIQALGGHIDGGGSVHFEGEQPTMSGLIKIRDIHLEQTLEGTRGEGDKPLPYAGIINGQVQLEGPLNKLTEQASGDGNIELTNGRLVQIPVLSAIRNAAKTVLTLGQAEKYDDEASLVFTFAGDRLAFSKIAAETGVVALRGKGEVHFDGTLDLRLNGGPLEKAQNMLGPIGDIMGKITDKLAGYEVSGTLDEPKVAVKVLSDVPGADEPEGETQPDPATPPEPAVADGPETPRPPQATPQR